MEAELALEGLTEGFTTAVGGGTGFADDLGLLVFDASTGTLGTGGLGRSTTSTAFHVRTVPDK